MSIELNKEISILFDKIMTQIINYINYFSENNQIILLDKLKSLDYFIKSKFSKEKNQLSSKKEALSIIRDIDETNQNMKENNSYKFQINEISKNYNFIPPYQIFINKLKRKIKEDHEKYKIQELGYLERISTLQNKLKLYEENKNIQLNNDKHENSEMINKQKIIKLVNPINNKKTNSFFEQKKNRVYHSNDKYYRINNNKNQNNKTFYQVFRNLNNNKQSLKEIDITNLELNNENSRYKNKNNVAEQNLFMNKYLVSLKNVKFKNRNINTVIKHNFKDIQREIENSKKKLRLLKDTKTPKIFRRNKLIIETEYI